ncbi:hypothetical protein AN221_23450 [Streptomyces nanshensis]|uniref:Uncharacterized protein n=1 Tax=Streptomyces nanshensis TaxID=518642 RepID=A0A1E7LPH6_9ACTN|nr:hypothetical protein AN221_23450 [Streptomyces nanshensis]
MGLGGDVEEGGRSGGQGVDAVPGGLRRLPGDPVQLRCETGEYGGGVEGVEGEEPDHGGGRSADRFVRGTVRRVLGPQPGRPCGEAEDDGLMGAARPGRCEGVEFGARPGGAGGPHQLAAELAGGGPQGG